MEADTIQAAAGEEFTVEFRENATTGYVWRLEPAVPGIEIVNEKLVLPGQSAVGGGGERRFCLRAPQPGVYVLQFRLRRAWEEEPLERRRITIEVR